MSNRILQVSYREGRIDAAYLYLPREPGDRATRTEEVGSGLLLDRREDGAAIGLEILSPGSVTLDTLNAVLVSVQQPPADAIELRPLGLAA